MSVVLVTCMENFVSMMCDGRLVKFKSDDKSDIEIVDEHIKKIGKINKNVCIGFGGDALASDRALKELNNYQVENLTLERIARIITNKAKEKFEFLLGVKIIIVGRNRMGKFAVHLIDSNNNFASEIYVPTGNEVLIKGAFPSNSDDIVQILDRHLYSTMPWKSIEHLKENMRKCIIDVSKIDKTVNKVIYEEFIS